MQVESELESVRIQLEEESEARLDIERQLVKASGEVQIWRSKYETEANARAEEVIKKWNNYYHTYNNIKSVGTTSAWPNLLLSCRNWTILFIDLINNCIKRHGICIHFGISIKHRPNSQVEELRRKYSARIQEQEEQIETLLVKINNLEKQKSRLQSEVEVLIIDLEKVRLQNFYNYLRDIF